MVLPRSLKQLHLWFDSVDEDGTPSSEARCLCDYIQECAPSMPLLETISLHRNWAPLGMVDPLLEFLNNSPVGPRGVLRYVSEYGHRWTWFE